MPAQVLQIPFAGGLDSKIAAAVLEPGQGFLQAQDVVSNRRGALDQRFGTVAQPKTTVQGGTIGAAVRVIGTASEELLVDGHDLFTFSESSNTWSHVDQVPEPYVTRSPLIQGGRSVSGYDLAALGSFLAVTYKLLDDHAGVTNYFAAVLDTKRGCLVAPPQKLTSPGAAYSNALVIAAGTRFVWVGARTGNLDYSSFDTTAPAVGWSAPASIANDYAGAGAQFDLTPMTSVAAPARFALAYKTARATDKITIKLLDAAASPSTFATRTTLTSGTANPTCLALGGSTAGRVWLAYDDATDGISVATYNPTSSRDRKSVV